MKRVVFLLALFNPWEGERQSMPQEKVNRVVEEEEDDSVSLISDDEVQKIKEKYPYNPWGAVREIEFLVALRQSLVKLKQEERIM